MRTLLINYWYRTLSALKPHEDIKLSSMFIIIEREDYQKFTFRLDWPTKNESWESKKCFYNFYNRWLNRLSNEPLIDGTIAKEILENSFVIPEEALTFLIDASRAYPSNVEMNAVML